MGFTIKTAIWVNYTTDLDNLLSIMAYNIVKKNCSFTSDVKQFYANKLLSNLLENKRKHWNEI